MSVGSAKHAGHVFETHTVVSASKVYMTPAVEVARPLHAAARPMTGSLGYAVWVPLVAAIIGALVGGFISWRALAWNTEREWKKRKAQARRALQVEMYANALRLRGAAQAIQQNRSTDLPDFLQGRRYDEAYRMHFTDAVSDAKWDDIEQIVHAYAYAETIIDGPLSINNWKRDPEGFPVKDVSTRSFAMMCATGAEIFCGAIRKLKEMVPVDEAFDMAVQKVEQDASAVMAAVGAQKVG